MVRLKGNMEDEAFKLADAVRGKPLCIEILMVLKEKGGPLAPSDISRILGRSLPTVNLPLTRMEETGILISKKEGRRRFYEPKNREAMEWLLESQDFKEYLRKSLPKLGRGSLFLEREFNSRLGDIMEKRQLMGSDYQPRALDTPLGWVQPDFCITPQGSTKRIWVEVKDFSGSDTRTLDRKVNELIGHLALLSRLDSFGNQKLDFESVLLILLLPSGELKLDKWKLTEFIESMSTGKMRNLVISETVSRSDLANPSFMENLANRIIEKLRASYKST